MVTRGEGSADHLVGVRVDVSGGDGVRAVVKVEVVGYALAVDVMCAAKDSDVVWMPHDLLPPIRRHRVQQLSNTLPDGRTLRISDGDNRLALARVARGSFVDKLMKGGSMKWFAMLACVVVWCVAAGPATRPSAEPTTRVMWRVKEGRPVELQQVVDAQPKLIDEAIDKLKGDIARIEKEVAALKRSTPKTAKEREKKREELAAKAQAIASAKAQIATLQRGDELVWPQISLAALKSGDITRLDRDTQCVVVQVLDGNAALVEFIWTYMDQQHVRRGRDFTTVDRGRDARREAWLIGPTAGMTDDRGVTPPFAIRAVGTKQYDTVTGATRTVLAVQAVSPDDFERVPQ